MNRKNVEWYDKDHKKISDVFAAASIYMNKQVVGYSGKMWHQGQQVRCHSLTDDKIVKAAKVVEIKNGLPAKVEINGNVETVLGWIIQAIPLIIRLVDSFTEMLKQIKKKDGAN